MRIIRSIISLYGFIVFSAIAVSPVCFAQSNQDRSTPSIDVPSLLSESGYKYAEVRKGLWKIPDIPYRGKNIDNLIIFLEPNLSNKTLRISFRLGFLRDPEETTEFKEKLKELSERFKPTELSLSGAVLFVFAEAAVDKLDKETLEKAIKEVGDVSDQAYSELRKYIELDLESRRAGVGAGAPGGDGALSPSIFKTPDSPGSNVARNVDSRPVALNRVTPGYTEEARKNKVNGIVTLRMLVDETGTVKNIRVIRDLPDGLTEKAIEAGYKMRFKPAMKDGKPVAYWVVAQVTFILR